MPKAVYMCLNEDPTGVLKVFSNKTPLWCDGQIRMPSVTAGTYLESSSIYPVSNSLYWEIIRCLYWARTHHPGGGYLLWWGRGKSECLGHTILPCAPPSHSGGHASCRSPNTLGPLESPHLLPPVPLIGLRSLITRHAVPILPHYKPLQFPLAILTPPTGLSLPNPLLWSY